MYELLFFLVLIFFSWKYSNLEQGTSTSIFLKPVYLEISSGGCILPGPVSWFNLLAIWDIPLAQLESVFPTEYPSKLLYTPAYLLAGQYEEQKRPLH